ncbi:MAG TPA: hemerythrin domain-containing protein [Stellaceae bacterium]|nr:hemerythrin domain-containing protein [Stellaceae bacterium]
MNSIDKARRKVGKAMSSETSEDDGDILDTLKQEHEEVADLLEQLVESESAASRRSLLKQIKAALVPHLRAEEKVVYDAIRALRGKEQQMDAAEGYFEHALGDRMLANLEKIDKPNSPEFSAGAKVLKELVEHHVEEEEQNVWKDVRENFSDEERIEMNRKFEAAKTRVRVA